MQSIEGGQRAAIEAVRKFIDSVDETVRGDDPSRRESVIDAALDMAERVVAMQSEFICSVTRSADQALRRSGDASQ